ncbi:N-acetyltransferase family protein [Falsiroseomonas sp. HW251]|uniref:GNAT family N-acetyltransferase n=1 Tax=Falsiroseomonas sp. HW251 TaxID=3390998 RepID=UPI003D323740
MSQAKPAGHKLSVEIATTLTEHDIEDLCEATNAAIIEGGGFGWVQQQDRGVLARHFRGVLLVPDRILFIARLDSVAVGSAQLVRPSRNNEAQAFAAQLTAVYIAPYARGFGLARRLLDRVEEHAAAIGFRVLNLDVRETQESAIALFENTGYTRWGTHPAYARVDGRTVAGHHYYKLLEPGRGRSTGSLIGGA